MTDETNNKKKKFMLKSDNNSKNTSMFRPILVSCSITFVVTLLFSFQVFSQTFRYAKETADKYARAEEISQFVNENFYKEVDEEKLMNSMLTGYVSGLDDKYSRYQTPEEYENTKQTDKGMMTGIGVTVEKTEDGYMKVTDITTISPAKRMGVLIGDIITAVDGHDVKETGYNESISLIKEGDLGVDVVLTIKRGDETLDLPVTRKQIEVQTVKWEVLEGNLGYIRIEHFRSNTFAQFETALKELDEQNVKGYIFDLRDDGGGLVNAMSDCLDPLLPEGDIAIATYRDGHTEVICKSDANETNLPMVAIMNGNTASSSELFIASLRDFKGIKTIGTKSFGKAIMQTTSPLKTGGAITVTVAEIKTTKSESYHGIGLYPDYEVELDEGVDINDKEHTGDNQLQKAVEVLKTEIN